MNHRVVITASASISSLGNDPAGAVIRMKQNRPFFENPDFDTDLVTAPVKDFHLKAYTGPYKNRRYLNRGWQFGLAAAIEAVEQSGLDSDAVSSAGLFCGIGPNLDIASQIPAITKGRIDPQKLNALWILKFLPNTMASAISDKLGIHGENFTVSTACATTLQVIGEAYRKVKAGYLTLAVAGGGDSRINPGAALAYKMADALYTGGEPPAMAVKPFDRDRSGFVMGEGGAFFVLERLDHALGRGATILGEISGFGSSMDGGNMTAPDPTGRWMAKAVQSALDESKIFPSGIDVVSSHGTGTVLNDAMEVELFNTVFRSFKPKIIALKSWIGHLSTACGAVELALNLALMDHGFLPKIRNLAHPLADNLNFVKENQEEPFQTVLLQNFGFGGQNGALVVKKWIP